MKTRFILFRRAGVFYSEDTTTRKQHSLRTKDEAEALSILHSKNEAHRQPVLNLQIARTYLTATDPEVAIGLLDRSEGFQPGRAKNSYVRSERHVLRDGDEVALIPPVAGG